MENPNLTHEEIVQKQYTIDKYEYFNMVDALLEKGEISDEKHTEFVGYLAEDREYEYMCNKRKGGRVKYEDHTCES